MNYSGIRVPFLDKNKIKEKADVFRRKFWDDCLPVDIEKIVNFKLGIKIIPTPNLRESCDIDAQISFNLRWIYVDYDMYRDERQQNRLRFSFAHEIGHYALHQNIYSQFKLTNIYKFRQIITEQISEQQYGYLETQANKFASYLLVPRERFEIEKNKLINQLKADPNFIKIKDNFYLAIPLSTIFGVSAEAMEIVLKDESSNQKIA